MSRAKTAIRVKLLKNSKEMVKEKSMLWWNLDKAIRVRKIGKKSGINTTLMDMDKSNAFDRSDNQHFATVFKDYCNAQRHLFGGWSK